jgi:hypothetical protein
MGERLEVNVQLKRLKDTKSTGDTVWKAWINSFPCWHISANQGDDKTEA